MASSIPTLPHPYLINGLNHIPPPPTSSFDSLFGFAGLLPEGTSLPSSWGTTRYYDFAPTSPPTSRRILLIHGGGTCAIGVAPLARILTEAGNHVVIYDLWGHGLSSTPLETHSPALMHAQIYELLVHLKWVENVNLIGFSLGGSIAATFAAIHGGLVESVVLVAPAGLWRKSERSYWDVVSTDGFGLPGFEWLRRNTIMSNIHGVNPIVEERWKERLMNAEVDSVPVEKWEREEHKGHAASVVSMWNYSVFDQHDSYAKLAEKGTKVLVILGEKDGVFEPDYSKKELKKLGWKGEIQIVDGATHQIIRAHRKEVAALCIDFWGKLEK